MTNDNILIINNLSKFFGGIKAVNDINIDVHRGDIFGIIGPNGAGKTTMFNLITGIYAPTSGKIIFDGNDITGEKTHMIAQKGIARTFQNIRLFGELTVEKNVLIACHKHAKYGLFSGFTKLGSFRREEKHLMDLTHDALGSVALTGYENMLAKNLPYGIQRRLEIARALAIKPKLLLLDEPAAGMNEAESKQLVELIKEIKEKYDIAIIIIDHHMDVIMKICNRIAVFNFGELLAIGTPEEIQNDEKVIEAYLGVDE